MCGFLKLKHCLDNRVTDADAPSYLTHSVGSVLAMAAEEDKKRKYVSAVEACRGSFSPFVVTVDGAMGAEAVLFLCHPAEKLSTVERGAMARY